MFFTWQGTLRDLFTIEPSEPTNIQPPVSKAVSSDEVEMGEESHEEPETSAADTAEVSGSKTGDGKMSQTLLEQVQHILIYDDHFSQMYKSSFY